MERRNRRLAPNTLLWVALSLIGEEGFRNHFGLPWSILLVALTLFILGFARELALLEWFSRKSPRVRNDILNFLRLLNNRDR